MVSSEPRFQVVEGWEQLPAGWAHPDTAAVAVDAAGQVFVFHRGEHPLIVYGAGGDLVRSWGDGEFTPQAHGITAAPDGSLYCTDRDHHTVRQFTPEGRLLLTLGTPNTPSDTGADHAAYRTVKHPGGPFNCPTNLAVAPSGDLYVSDGYSNCCVHRFSADGKLKQSWGMPGTGPGEFNLVHGIAVTPDGRVFVCDRENDRVQIFDLDGHFLDQWIDVQRPTQIVFDPQGWAYVSELPWPAGSITAAGRTVEAPEHARISIFDSQGQVLTRLGGPDPMTLGSFAAPHGLAIDSRGDLYVAEVAATAAANGWSPVGHATLQKFARVR